MSSIDAIKLEFVLSSSLSQHALCKKLDDNLFHLMTLIPLMSTRHDFSLPVPFTLVQYYGWNWIILSCSLDGGFLNKGRPGHNLKVSILGSGYGVFPFLASQETLSPNNSSVMQVENQLYQKATRVINTWYNHLVYT